MLKNFDLSPSVDFLLMWQENVTRHLSRQQECIVTSTKSKESNWTLTRQYQ
jgi:hypothetical protein